MVKLMHIDDELSIQLLKNKVLLAVKEETLLENQLLVCVFPWFNFKLKRELREANNKRRKAVWDLIHKESIARVVSYEPQQMVSYEHC